MLAGTARQVLSSILPGRQGMRGAAERRAPTRARRARSPVVGAGRRRAGAGASALAVLRRSALRPAGRRSDAGTRRSASPTADRTPAARCGRRPAGRLSVLADSALEHYRGALPKSRHVHAPGHVARSPGSWPRRHRATRDAAHARPRPRSTPPRRGRRGRPRLPRLQHAAAARAACTWQNLFYAAPLGAPAALSLCGLVGFAGGSSRPRCGASDARLADCRPAARSPGSPAWGWPERAARPRCCISAARSTTRSCGCR